MKSASMTSGNPPVVIIHIPARQIGLVTEVLEENGYCATPFAWLNARATDTGGGRFNSALQFIVIGTHGKTGGCVGKPFVHFNAPSSDPRDRMNFYQTGWHPGMATKHDGTVINPSEKPVHLLIHLFRLLGQPGGTVVDLCAGSCSALPAAWLTGRRYIAVDEDADQMTAAKIQRASFTGEEKRQALDRESNATETVYTEWIRVAEKAGRWWTVWINCHLSNRTITAAVCCGKNDLKSSLSP